MARHRKQERMGDVAELLLRRMDPEGKRFEAEVVAAWPVVAGPEIAKHTLGVVLRRGELVIHVDSNTWAAELSAMAGEFEQRLNERAGRNLVRSVRFTVSRKVADAASMKAGEEAVRGFYEAGKASPMKLDPGEADEVRRAVAHIDDPALRTAAERAMTRSLEWEKGRKAANGRQAPSQ